MPFGDGTRESPFAVNTPDSFAYIMREKVGENTAIRMGPGIYHTRGMGGDGYVMAPKKLWRPKPGQRIIGSGMFTTTLRFTFDEPTMPIRGGISAIHPGPRLYMIDNGKTFLHSFEISDLTVDCNLQNAPFDGDRITRAEVKAKVLTGGTLVETEGLGVFFQSSMIGKAIIFEIPQLDGSFLYRGSTIQAIVGSSPSAQATISPAMTAGNFNHFGITGMRCSLSGLDLCGENISVRRVRMINFGSRTPPGFDGGGQYLYAEGIDGSQTNNLLTVEGFPLRIEGRNGIGGGGERPSFNSWLEDCVIEQPYSSPAREVTMVVGGGVSTTVAPPGKLHLEPFGCGMRNCYR
jgi:hypothetical protein